MGIHKGTGPQAELGEHTSEDDLDRELIEMFDKTPSSPMKRPPLTRQSVISDPMTDPIFWSVPEEKQAKSAGFAAENASEALPDKAAEIFDGSPPKQIPRAGKVITRSSPHAIAVKGVRKMRRNRTNGFQVVGMKSNSVMQQTFNYQDDQFCNMSLQDAYIPKDALWALFEHCCRVDIAEVTEKYEEIRSGKLEYVIFGCLVAKHSKKETKNGEKYAVWSICNMIGKVAGSTAPPPKPTIITLLLFDTAFQAFHTKVEGLVIAMRKPHVLPRLSYDTTKNDSAGRAEYSDHCLKVNNKTSIIPLGVCKDLKLCEQDGRNLSMCRFWYDTNSTVRCPHHMTKKLVKNVKNYTMDYRRSILPSSRHKFNEVKSKVNEEMRPMNRLPNSTKRTFSSLNMPSCNSRHLDFSRLVKMKKSPGLQEEYEEAVDVLVRCGFILSGDGSLSPSPVAGLTVTLKTSIQNRCRTSKH